MVTIVVGGVVVVFTTVVAGAVVTTVVAGAVVTMVEAGAVIVVLPDEQPADTPTTIMLATNRNVAFLSIPFNSFFSPSLISKSIALTDVFNI